MGAYNQLLRAWLLIIYWLDSRLISKYLGNTCQDICTLKNLGNMHQGLSTSGSKLQARQHCKHHKQQLSTIEWSDFKKVHNNNDESILLSYSTIIKTRACREQLVIRVEQFQKGSLTVILFTLVTMHHIRGLIGNNTTIISFPWNEGSLSAYISESSKKFICRALSPNKPYQELHWRIKS